MVNDGQPCGIVNYGLPNERRNPATSGAITEPPKHGTAEFIGPQAQYTPKPGFTGEDEFAYEARAVSTGGQVLMLKVRVSVTVRP